MSAMLLVSGNELRFLRPGKEKPGTEVSSRFPFAVTARKGPGPTVTFSHQPAVAAEGALGEAITVEELGDQLAGWEDDDLLSVVLYGYFTAVARDLAQDVRSSPLRVYFPLWMGPRERRLLRSAMEAAGLSLQEEMERGLAPVLTRAWKRGGPPAAGGWIVADRCGSDLDLYGVFDRSTAVGRQIGLTDYRRCSQIFSSYYGTRPSARAEVLSAALRTFPAAWRLLVTDGIEPSLLASREPGALDPEVQTFAEHATALAAHERAPKPISVAISHHWRFWLDYGDDRLELLDEGGGNDRRVERLLAIPDSPPEHLRLGVRVGFRPTREESQEVCQVRISRPDLHYAAGFLLVVLWLRGHGGGDLAVDVIQRGRSVHSATATFSTS